MVATCRVFLDPGLAYRMVISNADSSAQRMLYRGMACVSVESDDH